MDNTILSEKLEYHLDQARSVNESFKSVQNKIAKKDGVSKKAAARILASASRNASAAAKRKNPKLKRVKG